MCQGTLLFLLFVIFACNFILAWTEGKKSRGSILVFGLRNEDPCKGKPDTPEQERSHPTGMEGTSCLLLLPLEASPTPFLKACVRDFPFMGISERTLLCFFYRYHTSHNGVTSLSFFLLLSNLELRMTNIALIAYLTTPSYPIVFISPFLLYSIG